MRYTKVIRVFGGNSVIRVIRVVRVIGLKMQQGFVKLYDI